MKTYEPFCLHTNNFWLKIFFGPLQDFIEFCFSRDSLKCRCFGQLEFEDFYFNFQGGIGFCGKDIIIINVFAM